MGSPFTIARNNELTYTTIPGGSFSGSDKLIYDIKKTKIIRVERNNENSLHVMIVNEDGNEKSGYIRAEKENEVGRRKLEVIEADADDLLGVSYHDLLHRQFFLKPETFQISVSDTLRVRTLLKGQVRRGEHGKVAPHYEFLEKEDTTADPRFSRRDVNVSMTINREGNTYHHKVTDAKTGEILHEEDEALSEHKSHNK